MAEPQKVTITGTLRRHDGTPDVGAVVRFERRVELRSGTSTDMIGPGARVGVANSEGVVSVWVYANDDAAWTPQGWSHRLTIGWSSGDRTYDVKVPYSATPVDLDSLLPLLGPDAGDMYAPIGHTHAGGGSGEYDPAGTAAATMAAHVAAPDPHPQYVTSAEGNAAYAAIGAPAAAVAAHVAAGDPHPQYLTSTEGNAAYETAGAVAAHVAAANPHPVYLTQAEGDAAYDALGAATAAVTAHEADADPHPQYPQVLVWDGAAYDPAPGAIIYVGGTVDPTGGAPDGSLWIKEVP